MVLNVIDEIIDGQPKYNITNNADGTKNIELANEVVAEGTALNRNLFNKIENILSYQVPTYTTEESVLHYDTKNLLSTIENDWVETEYYKQEATTQTTLGEFYALSDSNSSGKNVYYLFDDNFNTSTFISQNTTNSKFGFTNFNIVFTKIFITVGGLTNMYVNIDGIKKDGTKENILSSVALSYGVENEIIITNLNEYKYLSFYNRNGNAYFNELSFEFNINSKKYKYELGTIGTTLVNNQIVLLHTPNVEDLVHSATLNGIDIDTQLKSNSYYELVYNETQNKFIAQEVRTN